MYAIGIKPLINKMKSFAEVKQIWYADDATAVGSVRDLLSHGGMKSSTQVFYMATSRSLFYLSNVISMTRSAQSLFTNSNISITIY